MNSLQWYRPISGLDDFCTTVATQLAPWRDGLRTFGTTWSLCVSPSEVGLRAAEGPTRWSTRVCDDAAEVLTISPLLDPLARTIAADLLLAIATTDPVSWDDTLEQVRSWPHRRRWRSRGAGQSRRFSRMTEPPPRGHLDPTIEGAWTVLDIAVHAMPPGFGDDLHHLWDAIADHVRRQLAAFANPAPLSAGRA